MVEIAASENNERRRLTTVMAADICGYSRLAEANESAAIKTVEIIFAAFDSIVSAHHGRVFNRAGDGFLAEFPSAADGARAAMAFVNDIKSRDTISPNAPNAKVRVGLHVGDVADQPNGDLLGHGVNIAARLQSEAAPNGILVSLHAVNLLRDKVDAHFRRRGPMALKNIDETVIGFDLTQTKNFIPFSMLQNVKLQRRLAVIAGGGTLMTIALLANALFVEQSIKRSHPQSANAPEQLSDADRSQKLYESLLEKIPPMELHNQSPKMLAIRDTAKSLSYSSDPDKKRVVTMIQNSQIEEAVKHLEEIYADQVSADVDPWHLVLTAKEIGALTFLSDPALAKIYYTHAYELNSDDPIVLYQLATIHFWNRKYEESRSFFQSLKIAANKPANFNVKDEFAFRAALGLAYFDPFFGYKEDSEETLLALYETAKDKGTIFDEADILRALGTFYSRQGNQAFAGKYYSASLILERSISEEERLAKMLTTYGSFLLTWASHDNDSEYSQTDTIEVGKRLKNAEIHLSEAIAISKESKDFTNWSVAAHNLSGVNFEQGQYAAALENAEIAREIAAEKLKRRPFEADILKEKGKILDRMGEAKQACEAYSQARSIFLEVGNTAERYVEEIDTLSGQLDCV